MLLLILYLVRRHVSAAGLCRLAQLNYLGIRMPLLQLHLGRQGFAVASALAAASFAGGQTEMSCQVKELQILQQV